MESDIVIYQPRRHYGTDITRKRQHNGGHRENDPTLKANKQGTFTEIRYKSEDCFQMAQTELYQRYPDGAETATLYDFE